MSGQNPREIAGDILARRTDGVFVEDLLDQALARNPLSGPDRGLCQELVYGVVRWQGALDWLIGRKTSHPPDKPFLQILLRLGLYQIFWLSRIPNHAAVNETVELAKRKGLKSQAGFINAVLRGFLREFEPTQQALKEIREQNPAIGFSHPDWLVKRWQSRWTAAEVIRLMEWDNSPPKTFARVNALKITAAQLLETWREENVEYDFVRFDWVEENLVFWLKSHPPLHRLGSFRKGLFYVQDPSTLLSVRELAPKPGETVLDLCAAPGGKTTFIAQLMNDQGKIIAHEVNAERLQMVRENCERLGVKSVETIHYPPPAERVSSTRNRDAAHGLPASPGVSAVPYTEIPALPLAAFDRILVDAPCSNTGVMRRRVDLRWRIQPEEISRLHSLQSELLTKAAGLLKHGGTLVYSTCSLEPEENEQVITQFLASNPWFELKSQRQLLPFEHTVDGAFVAKLHKT